MATSIFINLPVKNLNASVAFFTQLGFSFNAEYTNEQGTCMIISDTISVMLLVESFFQTFTGKPLVNAHQANEAILCLSTDSRAEVDRIANAAVAAGGKPVPQQSQNEMEFMYDRNFQDLDGHLWNILYMDLNLAQQTARPEVATQ
ncbi:glyoxalase/bleomycin resistance/extradiol dioxygenase family protein [Hymenobacter taeanensis]|uniref:Glyoxalase/bleomycin resistance/extradiol dioxygenase family protein n=1 Tax=Hymenobacter taeanensis TaxID=2735321 RepID=A0A6M6BL20_9BACT|nr:MULTISPECIES: VOC family protein [Hymenobacter]QJX48660.1 glyoxalase/bleomycin resistance/extradiol dioxygenase family protein [Hymenobacter taeanensis]UOQ81841.1 glyoxalase/bleomycin resistance/extradiol dioxygenase family protein [Hymenobacter sp. 5414T-23]